MAIIFTYWFGSYVVIVWNLQGVGRAPLHFDTGESGELCQLGVLRQHYESTDVLKEKQFAAAFQELTSAKG
jgi:hypothetical protein